MPLRAVIFDLGHTVWDFAPRPHARRVGILRLYERLHAALGAGVPTPQALDRALAEAIQRWMDDWNSDRLEQPPTEELVRQALATVDVATEDGLLRELTATLFGSELDVPVIEPDCLAAIGRLHARGLAIGCVTNTILLEEAIHELLAKLGLLLYMKAVVVSSAMDYRKPHPSLFRRALEGLDVAAEDAVFVGDRLVDDVSGAQRVGMRAVLTHQYRQEPLGSGPATPDAVIERLAQLPAALDRLVNGASPASDR